jgi:8-hydroxy-5-deazaflavin:NADPH oxidoreductase
VAQISIIGTGGMGQALSTAFAKGGHAVEMIGHEDAGKAVSGDIVVLAVPYPALAEIAAARREQLSGKIVVDITNPVNFETFDSLTVPADSSATAELAAALPDATVLKAFNTTFAATLAAGTVGENPTTVLIAGDDAAAKAALAATITATGMNAIDAGALSRARELEAMGFLQITLAAAEKVSWTSGFAVVS